MSTPSPKICFVAIGLLIHEGKALLVKHRRAQIWLSPGGHIEPDELPHLAAEREFWEETGIRVKAVQLFPKPPKITNSDTEFIPSPFLTNMHWVSRKNFAARTQNNETQRDSIWHRGCEQHLGFLYLVEPLAGVEYTENTKECDGIAWYNREEIAQLETYEDIRAEILTAFEIVEIAKRENHAKQNTQRTHTQKSPSRGHRPPN